ncbi:alkaline phosphatase family protein [Halorutilales archaeon Cl-col2-1]
MTLVVLGIDALDPELADPDDHPHLTLCSHASIDTIVSSAGEPSTHELWPSIITGLTPEEHGLKLDEGVSWENPVIDLGSEVADYVVPDGLQTLIGAWLLNNTEQDAFRVPATYYDKNGLETLFDGREAKAIGVPNYVTDPDDEDREHQLRRDMDELFERDTDAKGGHTSDDPVEFYELCMEMSMVRIALVRRALRSMNYELVFGYTSGLDLIGHVSYDLPELQDRAYEELNDFVGELRGDLSEDDELVVVSDHGLQDGVHTDEAFISSTDPSIVESVEGILDLRGVVNEELERGHIPDKPDYERDEGCEGERVKEQLEDLGYM